MEYWREYVKASYDLVTSVTKVDPELNQTLESYLVHLLARNFRNTAIYEKPIAIRFMESISMHGSLKRQFMADIGDECLFIDGFSYRKPKWPCASYFRDMGTMAYGHASVAPPADPLYSHLEDNFTLLSTILSSVQKMSVR